MAKRLCDVRFTLFGPLDKPNWGIGTGANNHIYLNIICLNSYMFV